MEDSTCPVPSLEMMEGGVWGPAVLKEVSVDFSADIITETSVSRVNEEYQMARHRQAAV